MSNLTLNQAINKLDWANKRCKFAWAKYYEGTATAHGQDHRHYAQMRVVSEDAMPTHIKNLMAEMATELKKKWECPICIDFIPEGSLEITNCGHFYCKPCLEQLKKSFEGQDKWECATCRRKHS
jgi:hypothetical protein